MHKSVMTPRPGTAPAGQRSDERRGRPGGVSSAPRVAHTGLRNDGRPPAPHQSPAPPRHARPSARVRGVPWSRSVSTVQSPHLALEENLLACSALFARQILHRRRNPIWLIDQRTRARCLRSPPRAFADRPVAKASDSHTMRAGCTQRGGEHLSLKIYPTALIAAIEARTGGSARRRGLAR